MNDEEKALLIEFMNYRAWYANAQDNPPQKPENVGDDMTAEKQVQIVDGLLSKFEERLGNPLTPCAKCGKRCPGARDANLCCKSTIARWSAREPTSRSIRRPVRLLAHPLGRHVLTILALHTRVLT